MKIIKNKLYAIKTYRTVRTTFMGMERLQYHTIWAFDMMSDVNEFMKRHGEFYSETLLRKIIMPEKTFCLTQSDQTIRIPYLEMNCNPKS
jgi:hypothetical protein